MRFDKSRVKYRDQPWPDNWQREPNERILQRPSVRSYQDPYRYWYFY